MTRRQHNLKRAKQHRRALRKQATPAEARLWSLIRNRQLKGRKFRRQYSIGLYIVDFYCSDEMLAIELDGSVHDDPYRHQYDGERNAFLNAQGVHVLRFENQLVFDHPNAVLEHIASHFIPDE